MNMMTTSHTYQNNNVFRDATCRLVCVQVMDKVIMKMGSLSDEHT